MQGCQRREHHIGSRAGGRAHWCWPAARPLYAALGTTHMRDEIRIQHALGPRVGGGARRLVVSIALSDRFARQVAAFTVLRLFEGGLRLRLEYRSRFYYS